MSHLPADENTQDKNEFEEKRSLFRLEINNNQRVILRFNLEGVKIDAVVEELGGGGARLMYHKQFTFFYEAQMIGPAVLILQPDVQPVVHPVVKWKSWPNIGVQFMRISEKDRQSIMRFLFRAERNKVRHPDH